MTQYIIYAMLDPRPHKLNQLRYVGKSETGKQRWREHLKPSSLKNNLPKDNWIKKLLALNLKPIFIILEEFSSASELFEAEIFYCTYYRSLGCDLLNMTDGGDGTRGYKHREDTIQKMKEIALNRDKTNYQNPHNKKVHIEKDGKTFRNCKKCGEDKEISLFTWNKKQEKYGPYCKPCQAVHKANWRAKNPAPTLPREEYLASRKNGYTAGGEAMKRPELRKLVADRQSKPIRATSLTTTETLTFASALAAKEAGFQNSNISQAIKFKRPYRGYMWKFI